MTKITLQLTLLILVLVCPLVIDIELNAEELEDRKVLLNSRVFDLEVDATSVKRDADFIPLNRIPWLNQLIQRDPLLGDLVLNIRALDHSAEYLWSFPGPGKQFLYSEGISDNLALRGYEAKTSTNKEPVFLLYVPYDASLEYSAMCTVDRSDRSTLSFCSLFISYPWGQGLFVEVRMYHPERRGDLAQDLLSIAKYAREVVYCLDVTNSDPNFFRYSEELEELRGCSSEDIS